MFLRFLKALPSAAATAPATTAAAGCLLTFGAFAFDAAINRLLGCFCRQVRVAQGLHSLRRCFDALFALDPRLRHLFRGGVFDIGALALLGFVVCTAIAFLGHM